MKATLDLITSLENKKTKRLQRTVSINNKTPNPLGLNPELFNQADVFSLDDIKSLCIDYRLRFLEYNYYKNSIPVEAIEKIKKLEETYNIKFKEFKIVAPAKVFRLKNADDPLLFAGLDNNYFLLIHKWGNDLHPLRKIFVWPYKSLENTLSTIVLLSILLTFLVPDGLFSKEQSVSQTFIVFLFMLKWVAGIVLFYGVARGKNFNENVWNSTYFNS